MQKCSTCKREILMTHELDRCEYCGELVCPECVAAVAVICQMCVSAIHDKVVDRAATKRLLVLFLTRLGFSLDDSETVTDEHAARRYTQYINDETGLGITITEALNE